MQKNIQDIARIVGGEVIGSTDVVIRGFSGIQEAKEGDLTFVASSKYVAYAKQTKASAIVVSSDVSIPGKTVICVDNPSKAFTEIILYFSKEEKYFKQGIDSKAAVSDNAKIGKNVSIGPFVVIESDVKIGDNTIICAGSYVGHKTKIGCDCLIYPNVTIREKTSIGDRVIIHSGAVLAADGFGYIKIDGVHEKIPQIGVVVIEDDVEIGANVTIDRARFDKTIVGKGTKIDNLIQVAHNVVIGKNCLVLAQVGISGSTIIENGCILAGQVGVTGHLTIGKNTIVASRGVVTKSIGPNITVSGNPAKPHMEAKRINACVQNLPKYVKTIQELKKRIEELELKINKS